MSKKKGKRQKHSSVVPRKAKSNLVFHIVVTIGLVALVVTSFAVLSRPQPVGQMDEQILLSSDSATLQEVDSPEVSSAALSKDEGPVIENTAIAEVADEVPVVEEVAAELPIAPTVGALAPDFDLTTINGEQLALADVRGKPMFISFFHSW